MHIGRKTNPKKGITDPSHCGFKQVSLSAFEGVKMTSVSSLNFDYLFDSDKMCQPAGNLSALKWFPNLRSLRLGRQVVGSVKDLLPLVHLESINLQGTFFSGVLDDLKPMASLKNLTISYTSIHGGDLKILQYMTGLEKLSLDYFPIHSPLNLLQHLKDLKYLRIRMCGIPGNLADLEPLTKLEELILQEIGGPLHGLRKMKKLKRLSLKSKVDGYLSDLRDLNELSYLDLAEGQVIGNLTDLREMKKLQHLSLRKFNEIEGSTVDLRGMTHLRFMELPSTTLSGDIADLWHLNQLERFAAGHVHFMPSSTKTSQHSKASKELWNGDKMQNVVSAPSAVPDVEDKKLRNIFKLSSADNLCESSWITCTEGNGLTIGRKGSRAAGLSNPKDCLLIQVNLNAFAGTRMTSVTGLVFDDVYMCQPSGSLSALKWFPNLKTFRLNRGNQLVGQIKDLQLATKLEHLSFRGSPATGKVEDLARLTHLKSLTLSFSSIHGNLSSLQYMTELTYLEITNLENMGPGIAGDLLDLQTLVKLEHVELSEIGGNLYGLRNMKSLMHVDVKAEVVGFLADLMPLSQLKYLEFKHGQVIGSLDDLKVLGNLEHLSLSNFNPLEGNFAQLVQMTRLREYNVPTTKLLGYYDDFKKFKLLRNMRADHVDLW